MGRYTQERLTERFEAMRARQAELQALQAEGAPLRKRPRSEERIRRETEHKAAVPPHLDMYRVNEVVRMLGVSRRTVERWFRSRAVLVAAPGAKGTLLISRQLLEEWVKEHSAH